MMQQGWTPPRAWSSVWKGTSADGKRQMELYWNPKGETIVAAVQGLNSRFQVELPRSQQFKGKAFSVYKSLPPEAIDKISALYRGLTSQSPLEDASLPEGTLSPAEIPLPHLVHNPRNGIHRRHIKRV
ncbi:MAG: hypothetical protein J5J00_05660 [Deltaproteobacteria bacterium]|nr:hypothetical protein [Deltaproteobacteria bacterium]